MTNDDHSDLDLSAAERHFRVAAWAGGSGGGRLTVAPGSLTFDPGPISGFVLRLSGRLVHRSTDVVVVSRRVGSSVIVLRASSDADALVQSPLLAHAHHLTFVSIRPLRLRRVLAAIRCAGFDVHTRRRWYYSGFRPID